MMSEEFRDKTRRLGGWGGELENWIKDIQEMVRDIQTVAHTHSVVTKQSILYCTFCRMGRIGCVGTFILLTAACYA